MIQGGGIPANSPPWLQWLSHIQTSIWWKRCGRSLKEPFINECLQISTTEVKENYWKKSGPQFFHNDVNAYRKQAPEVIVANSGSTSFTRLHKVLIKLIFTTVPFICNECVFIFSPLHFIWHEMLACFFFPEHYGHWSMKLKFPSAFQGKIVQRRLFFPSYEQYKKKSFTESQNVMLLVVLSKVWSLS